MGREHSDMLFIRHQGEVEYARKLQVWFQNGLDNREEMADLLQSCVSTPCSGFFVCDAELFDCELNVEVQQRCKHRGLLVGWPVVDIFAVPSATRKSVYTMVPSF